MRQVATFAPISEASAAQLPNARTFFGEGSQVLKVPGLKECQEVYVDGILIPQSQVITVPKNAAGVMEEIETPLWTMSTLPTSGETILLRSDRSNDGIWQKDSPVVVVGEWENVSNRKLQDMTRPELMKIAEQHDIKVDSRANKDAILTTLRENGIGVDKEEAAA